MTGKYTGKKNFEQKNFVKKYNIQIIWVATILNLCNFSKILV